MEATMQMQTQQPSGAIPLGLRYNLGVQDSIKSDRTLRRFQAENPSVFTPNNNVVRIPISSEKYL